MALTIVNGVVYYIKTNHNKTVKNPVMLHKLEGYLTGGAKKHSCVQVKTSSEAIAIAKHVNSITYRNGLFYITTMNGEAKTANQVMAFGTDGIIQHKYSFDGGDGIGTIDYYDTKNNTPRFLISLGHSTDASHEGKVKFQLVKLSDSTNKIVESTDHFTFYAKCPYDTYFQGNDCYYDCSSKNCM